MKRVAFLFPNFFFIGAQRAAASTIRKLDRSMFKPFVFVVDPSGDMQNEIPEDVEVHILPLGGWLSRIPFLRIFIWPFQLRRLLHKAPVDQIVSICPQTNFTLVLYKLLFKKTPVFIGEEHQHLSNAIKNDPGDFKYPWKFLYYFSLRNYHRLDRLRCVSKSAAADFEKAWGVPKDKIVAIYPAFDLDRIQQRAHGRRPQNPVPVICSVGRLTSQKNFSLLIRAFAIVRRSMEARLQIAGTGSELAELTQLIEDLNIRDDVELLGFVEYAEEIIAGSDLFVMTSVWEGFPATLVEAMTLGTPVVSVNCESGPSELIEHGVNGYLVEQFTPEAVAEAILELLAQPELRGEMSRNALAKIQKFSLDTTVSELQNLLLSLD